ncbi:hypothetical protein MMOR_55610 [Mycolicibacterium moriokaense]|uniref:Uncharacterized protein n=1 Tax=Mycolicibacterium moriokaense TaxID=39691 RepID=A0AAD1HH09_9MYCO|nr:hypothetical protein MMOR_55610 [Mycolicibacterium moriokaense]
MLCLRPREHVRESVVGAVGVELVVEEVVAAAGGVVHQLADGGLRFGWTEDGLAAVEAVKDLELAELGDVDATGASRSTRPYSTSWSAAVVATALVMDALRNMESGRASPAAPS